MSHVGYHPDLELSHHSPPAAVQAALPGVPPAASATIAPPAAPQRSEPPFDRQQLLDRCMGNLAFAERLLASFERRFVADLAQIEQNLAARNTTELVRLAHQLKGASANMSAPRLQRVAAEIEQYGRADRLDVIPEQLALLRQEWEYFNQHRASQNTNQSLEEPRR